ncbi:methyl-accepting chemotaxis protein [Pseudomonas frederiksbergensis]|uniref:methyl-accepting chemotaxis protein n=1 Tax=Pseudomonas frederiksbergensis TaxID=104087 RepID=UPI003D1D9E32
MLTHLKVRTGMIGVLIAFVFALLLASLNGFYGARTSDEQIRDLNLLTAVQLDKLNNAAIWVTRASATSHSSLLDRLAGRTESADQGVAAAKERLNNAQKLISEIIPTLTDPQLIAAGRELEQVFSEYAKVVRQQINSTRLGDLVEYSRMNDSAKTLGQRYGQVRDAFTALITSHIAQTMTDSRQRIHQAQLATGALLVLTLLLAIACWVFISNRVLLPLRQAGERFNEMARGDLSQPITAVSRNEIGQLFASLANMQKNQRDTLSQLSKTAALVSDAAHNLNGITRESSRDLQQQHAELEMAVTAVTEMTSAVEEVSRNAVSTSEAATASNRLANESREQVRRVRTEIDSMNTDVQSTGEVIQRLASQTRDIGKVLDVIRSVSEQTNLLALNAAIEAARAGESGRGFAVVADEVRTLAYRTQQSTLEIEEMVGSIQTSSSTAVQSIAKNSERVQHTLESTQTSERMLEDIFSAIAEINERNLVIASATEEQAQVSREVDHNLLNIRHLAARSGEDAAKTEQSSQELSRLAVEMNEIVGRFKL